MSVRGEAWPGPRLAWIVDLSATGARIDGLEAPTGSELQLAFTPTGGKPVHRRARVMRSGYTDAGRWVGIAFIDAQPEHTRAA